MLKIEVETISSIHCILNDCYKPLYEKFFKPSLADAIPLITHECEDVQESGFGTPGFLKAISFKVEAIIESLRSGDIVIWSDVDLFFVQPIKMRQELSHFICNCDLAFSPELSSKLEINSGFFVARGNQDTIAFFTELLQRLKSQNTTEQPMINQMLKTTNIRWKLLPRTYWNLTVAMPIPKDVRMIHANWVQYYQGKDYVDCKINALTHLQSVIGRK